MLLIGHYDSPYVRRVAISLHLLGIPFERRPLSVFRHGDELRAFNPLGRVPALVLDTGECLIDSAAILDHLDETVGEKRALLPRVGEARRTALQTVALATGVNDKAMAIVYERRKPPAKVDEDWIGRSRQQLETALDALEKRLFPGPQDRFMQPEITAAAALGYVRLRVPEALPEGRNPNLRALARRAEALPAFQACRPSIEEIGGPPEDARAALLRLQNAGVSS